MKVVWNGITLAESDKTIVVEGNHYFPPESINRDYFKESSLQTVCAWKGKASYYDLVGDGSQDQNAAWYYPNPSSAAANITNYVAFYRHLVDIQN